MEILHTCTWLQQLCITRETKTDQEKSVKKTVENVFKTFQLRRNYKALILLVANIQI